MPNLRLHEALGNSIAVLAEDSYLLDSISKNFPTCFMYTVSTIALVSWPAASHSKIWKKPFYDCKGTYY